MTSDTKVGLLLGLVFIFVIAFLINGLPSFQGRTHGNELTDRLIGRDPEAPGLAAQERQVQQTLDPGARPQEVRAYAPALRDLTFAPPAETATIRNRLDLGGIARADQAGASLAEQVAALAVKKLQGGDRPGRPTDTAAGLGVHIVQASENLATIAKHYYGPERGNRQATIKRLFEANRGVLKSADRIRVGQRLVIPALSGELRGNAPVARQTRPPSQPATKKVAQYRVQSGDNLWKIASRLLGDGNRYLDILRLNQDRLDNEDSLQVGMELRLPKR